MIALDRQGTQQQRLESPTVTPCGMLVNTRYIFKNLIQGIILITTYMLFELMHNGLKETIHPTT